MNNVTKHIFKPTHRIDVTFTDARADKPCDGLSCGGRRDM
jgi:hypothetical protein